MNVNSKIFSLVLAAAVAISSSMSAYAIEADYFAEDSALNVRGNKGASDIVLAIMPYDYHVDNLDIDAINNDENILFYHVKADGDYNEKIPLSLDIPSGKYRVSEITKGEYEDVVFFIMSESKLAEASSSLNDANSPVEAVRVISALLSDFDFVPASRAEDIGKYMYNAVPKHGYSNDDFLTVFTLYEGVSAVKNGEISFSCFMSEYRSVIDKSLIELYSSLSDKQKMEADEVIRNISFDSKTAEEIISEVIFVSKTHACGNYEELKELVEEYCEKTSVDTGNYKNLSNYAQNSVFITLFGEKNKFTDAAYIVKRLQTLSKVQSDSASGAGGGGGNVSAKSPGVSGGGYQITNMDKISPADKILSDVKFSDIENHWAKADIEKMNALGIVNGTGDGFFEPDRSVTRAEFVKMLTGVLKIETGTASCSFSDVSDDSWYYGCIAAGVAAGIVNGISEKEFAPQAPITREDAATMVYRAVSEALSQSVSDEFADDGEISSYAAEGVKALSNAGIIRGSEGYFRPKADITRAEAASLLLRVYDLEFAQDTEKSGSLSEIKIVDDKYLKPAEKLIEALIDKKPFVSDTVSKGEFVSAVADIMLVSDNVSFENIYSDVSANYKYAPGITAAAGLGWIPSGGNFNPESEIQLNEALNILVSAANYGDRAMVYNGGYPNGYMAEANRLKLLRGIKSPGSFVTPDMAKIMLFNLLRVNKLDIAFSTNGGNITTTKYEDTGETLLSYLYDIEEIDGIVTETPFNSFSYDSEVDTNVNYVVINGVRYDYEGAQYNILGRSVHAFVRKDDGTVVAMETEQDNEILTCDLHDLSMTSKGDITYCTDSGELRTVKYNGGIAVYNGRTLRSLTSEYFEGDGYAEFIDNDDDGKYEVVHITSYSYVVVGNVDGLNRRIGDANFAENSLDFSGCDDGMVKFYDINGDEISIYGIQAGMVLETIVPEDTSFAVVSVIENSVTGELESIDKDSLGVGGTKYEVTQYFDKYGKEDIAVGINYKFYIGYGGRIVMAVGESDKYKYAFLMNAFMEDNHESVGIKIFDEDSSHETLELADKIYIDGQRIKDPENALSVLRNMMSNDATRMFRYKINSAGMVNRMDFPLEYDYEKHEEMTANEDNKMIYYPDYHKTVRYRNGRKIFTGDVSVADAVCFVIPTDLSEEKDFFGAGECGSIMRHDTEYQPYIYDVDETGSAGALVIRGSKSETYIGSDASYIVEEVNITIDEDEEVMKLVKCWNGTKMCEFYLPDDTPVNKDSGNTLVPGDIIRIMTDKSNHIFNLQVDFDYSNFAVSSTIPSWNYMQKTSSLSYWDGIAYSVNRKNRVIQLAYSEDDYGEIDLSIPSLATMSANTSNILRFDCELKSVRPVTLEEIKTWREFGNNNDYIVMRCNYDAPDLIVVYDGYNK